MADFSALKTAIQANIRTNGNEEITGAILQDILLSMVTTMGDGAINSLVTALQEEVLARQNAVGGEAEARQQADSALGGRIDGVANSITAINTKLAEGYIYVGIATPSTNPSTPTGKVFYIALQGGTYTNFSGLTVTQGINILKYNGSAWSLEQLWGVDDVPTAGSNNLVKSGGVFNVGQYINNIIYYQSIPLCITDINKIDLSTVGITRGKILKSSGIVEDFSSNDFAVTDLIEGLTSPSNTIKIVLLNNKVGPLNAQFSTIAWYYKKDGAYNFLSSNPVSLYNGKIIIPNNMAIRICGGANDIKDVEYGLLNLNSFDFASQVKYNQNQDVSIIKQNFKNVGDAIESSSIISSSFITTEGFFHDTTPDANWKIFIFDVTSLRGNLLYLQTPIVTSGTNMMKYGLSSVNDKVDNLCQYHLISSYNELENYIYIPLDSNINYLLISAYKICSLHLLNNESENTEISGNELLSETIVTRKYINSAGGIIDVAADNFKLNYYSIEDYRKQKILIKGDTSSNLEMCIIGLANSVNDTTVVPILNANGYVRYNKFIDVYAGSFKYLVVSQNRGDDSVKAYVQADINRIMDCDVLICPVYGQSLAIGGEAYPVITKEIKYPWLQVGVDINTAPLPSGVETSGYGLSEGIIDFYCQKYRVDVSKLKTKIFAFNAGVGSSSIMALKKGTEPYTNLISTIQTAYNNATTLGLTCKVSPIAWIQGEADLSNGWTQDWKGEVEQLQLDLDTDIKVITGQQETIKLMLYQTTYGARFDCPDVLNAQEELIQDNTRFIAITPLYIMDYYHSSNDQWIHIDGYSQKLLGFYCAKSIINNIFGNLTKGCSVQSIDVSGQDIIITLNTPSRALYVDDGFVKKVNNYGFSVLTTGNVEILDEVEISVGKIVLKCTSNITSGIRVRYGIANGSNVTGRTDGPRGNIRDNDGSCVANVGGYEIPLYDWLYAFEKTIQS